MTEMIKNGDFVELDYTGVLKDADITFDTTSAAVAKEKGIFDPKVTYEPVSICIGQGQILQGLDASLEGLEVGKESEILLPPERAFGRKDGKLMKLVPTSTFKKQGVNPVTGLQVNIDGMIGTIRTVTGGRTVVDFNHPFSGKEVIYRVTIRRKLTDEKDKVIALVELALNQKKDALKIDIKDGKAKIEVAKKFPDELFNLLKERVTKLIPTIKEVEFVSPKAEAKPKAKEDGKEDVKAGDAPGHKDA